MQRQRLAVPAYFPPGEQWTLLASYAPAVAFAVMNPDNGPGKARDDQYALSLASAQAAGIAIVGYVDTCYGEIPLRTAQQQIDCYRTWYGVGSIFFDRAANTSDQLSYYHALYDYVRSGSITPQLVLLNPGTYTHEGYMQVCDIICTAEMDAVTYLKRFPGNSSWTRAYEPAHFWHIVYGVSGEKTARKVIAQSQRRHAGYLFITEQALPNPYGELPDRAIWEGMIG